MPYLKFCADQLFDGYNLLDDQQALIVTETGIVEAIVPKSEAGDELQQLRGILSPGFINCHCHLELSHMKGIIPEHTGLVPFVWQVVKDRHFPETTILAAIKKAEDEMLQNGIVAVGDICNNTLTISQKAKARVRYHNFIEASGFSPSIALQRFERARAIRQEYEQGLPAGAAAGSIVPHAPYSVAETLWQMIVQFPGNGLLTIHNQESVAENELFLYKTGEFLEFYEKMGIDIAFFEASGKSSLQTFLPRFQPQQSLILVHNVFTTPQDLKMAQQPGGPQLYWCLCPNANLYISDRLPDIGLLLENNCSLVLGTDSLASNWQLSILSEIQTIRRHFPFIPARDLLTWATSNGARALQMDHLLGSFEKGKQPGVLLCDTELTKLSRLV